MTSSLVGSEMCIRDRYERNRRFGHLVRALGRAASGAKLPSAGSRLNASKPESRLVTATIPLCDRFRRKAAITEPVSVTKPQERRQLCRSRLDRATPATSYRNLEGVTCGRRIVGRRPRYDRTVVLSRAAITPRSIETRLSDRKIRRCYTGVNFFCYETEEVTVVLSHFELFFLPRVNDLDTLPGKFFKSI